MTSFRKYAPILLVLLAVAMSSTASATEYIGRGRYVGVINDVRVDVGMTIIADDSTGFTAADLTGVSTAEYAVLAPYLASGFCRFAAQEEGGAINLARLTGGEMVSNTVTSWGPGGPTDDDGDDIKHGIWIRPVGWPFVRENPHELDIAGGNPVGTVPRIPSVGSHVEYADWTERWTQVAPGVIHAVIRDRSYTVDGEEFHTTWTTEINYDPTRGSLPFDQERTTRGATTTFDERAGTMHIEMTSTVSRADGGGPLPLGGLLGLGLIGLVGMVRIRRAK